MKMESCTSNLSSRKRSSAQTKLQLLLGLALALDDEPLVVAAAADASTVVVAAAAAALWLVSLRPYGS